MFKVLSWQGWAVCLWAATASWGCQRSSTPEPQILTVFAASSLGPLLEDLSAEFRAANPQVQVRLELSASRLACLKVTHQGREADVVLSADAELIDDLLMPDAASFDVLFAQNGLVLAYNAASPLAAALQSGTPWQKALARGDWRVGIANPEIAPVGYRALLALRLNDTVAARELRLGSTIAAGLRPEWQRPDVTKLLAPLQAGELDAAFVYRSEALQHGLPYVTLDRRIDFSNPAFQTLYASAAILLPESKAVVHGNTAWYGATIPFNAPQPNLARLYLNHLLSEAGRGIAAEHHLPLVSPSDIRVHGHAPPGLLASAER